MSFRVDDPNIENEANGAFLEEVGFDKSKMLSILARADSLALKQFSETLLDDLGAIEVMESRTGLVMVPMRDSVKASEFHLGEALVAQAHIRLLDHGREGYGMIVGRDLEKAMAMALVDGAFAAGIAPNAIKSFVLAQSQALDAYDEQRLCEVNATRVEMETF